MKVFLFLGFMVMNLAAEQDKGKPPIIERNEITVGSTKYTGAKLVLVKPNEVAIKHATGVSRVHPSTLDPELAKELGYDKAASDALEAALRKTANRKANVNMLIKGAFSATIQVISITEEGLLGSAFLQDDKGQNLGRSDIFIETPTAGLGYLNDKSYEFGLRRMGNFTYTTVLGAEKTVAKYKNLLVILDELDAQNP
jgi:hypothetical protein